MSDADLAVKEELAKSRDDVIPAPKELEEGHEGGFNVPFCRWDGGVFTVCMFQLLIIILYSIGVDYDDSAASTENTSEANNVGTYYSFYTDVAFMIFIGFGFLMTFLKRHVFSSVGFTFLIGAFCMEWGILVMGFWEEIHESMEGHGFHKIHLNIVFLIEGCFSAGAVLISYGAMLGRITPIQLIMMAIFEIVWYGFNFFLGSHLLQAIDMGGSMFVHMFGAYFGLACGFIINQTDSRNHPRNCSSYSSDTFAMIGAIFLWILWPSFNGALAPSGSQFRVVINTVLSLSACCVSAFMSSRLLRGKHQVFDMVDIQNATLAGGVAVGSSADLVISPPGALAIGTVAGFVSVFGYVYITPFMDKFLRIQDTCGVHNLHGMPGVMGAVAGIISSWVATEDDEVYGNDFDDIFPRGHDQPGYQCAAMFITLGLAITGGLVTGCMIKVMTKPQRYFNDDVFWEMPEDPALEDIPEYGGKVVRADTETETVKDTTV